VVERLSRLDAAVAMSNRVAEIYTQLGVDERAVRVLHLTVRHLQDLRPKRIEAPPSPVRFATLNGAASEEKGAEVVLGAAEELVRRGYGGRFELAAFGYVGHQYEARMRGLPGVSNGGIYEPTRLEEVLAPFDVGIVPSVWEEAYGYVGVEFLACGLPVIGNARGGIVDYTRDGETGWVNRGADASGMADIMASIIDEPAQVVELNARIRADRDAIVKPFDRHVGEMRELYSSVRAARLAPRGG
jgi:glycosyltransferase involved in cell wall biosynthesis